MDSCERASKLGYVKGILYAHDELKKALFSNKIVNNSKDFLAMQTEFFIILNGLLENADTLLDEIHKSQEDEIREILHEHITEEENEEKKK